MKSVNGLHFRHARTARCPYQRTLGSSSWRRRHLGMLLRPGGRPAVCGQMVSRHNRILPLHPQRDPPHQAVPDAERSDGSRIRLQRHVRGPRTRPQEHQRSLQLRGVGGRAEFLHLHADGLPPGNQLLTVLRDKTL
jgi:hypothetical protein